MTRDLLAALAPTMRDALAEIALVASDTGARVFLVGGCVRDLLLGRPGLDLDLAVEGDALQVADALVARHGLQARIHRRFGTAVLHGLFGLRVDLASTRRETYPQPAALPVVSPASIEKDLFRRDFTVNAMAVAVPTGELLDPYGGRQDLERRLVRILHPQSFQDDPTRIFRSFRFEQRLDFELASDTEAAARAAWAEGYVDRLSMERIRDELLHMLEERHPVKGFRRLRDFGMLALVHPALRLTDEVEHALARAAEVPFHEVREVHQVRGAALLSHLTHAQQTEVLMRYRMAGEVSRGSLFLPLLQAGRGTFGQVVLALRHVSTHHLVVARVRARHPRLCRALERFWHEGRAIRPLVRGRDLLAWGYPAGPAMKARLDLLLRLQVEGRFTTLEEARHLLDGPG